MQQLTQWQKVENIFNRAVMIPGQQRNWFIEKECTGDPVLQFEVLSLLEADSESDQILQQSVFPLVANIIEDHFSELLKKSDFGSYKLIKLLGRGGMGAVFLANDSELDRPVAIKVLPATIGDSKENALRFRQEARAASAVAHPNVAHIYEFGEFEKMPYLVMEYIPGRNLRELINEKQIDLKFAVSIALQIAKGLKAVHEKQITHRDIKPENIIINGVGLIKIVDFGLAKFGTSPRVSLHPSVETVPGIILGTTSYMSPEQIRGVKIDEKTDIWSLGVLFSEMLFGKLPFTGETTADVHAAILSKEPAISELHAENGLIRKILCKSLAKEVTNRYQSVEELILDLLRLQHQLEEEKPTSRVETPVHFTSEFFSFQSSRLNPESQPQTYQNFEKPNEVTFAAHSTADSGIFEHKIRRIPAKIFIFAFLILGCASLTYFFNSYSSTNNSTAVPRIAVLPFENVKNDPDLDYFSDSIAENIINDLSALPEVKVIARNSSFNIKEQQKNDLQQISQALDAEIIVTGRVFHIGNQLIISVEMANASDKTVIWGEQYNRNADDLLDVQAEISKKIAKIVPTRLTERAMIEKSQPNRERGFLN